MPKKRQPMPKASKKRRADGTSRRTVESTPMAQDVFTQESVSSDEDPYDSADNEYGSGSGSESEEEARVAQSYDAESAFRRLHGPQLSLKERGLDEALSDDEVDPSVNTIGEVPLKWYDEYDHVGYSLEGKPVVKSDIKGDEIDKFLERDTDMQWRRIWDEKNQRDIVLTDAELMVLRNVQKGKYGDPNIDPYENFLMKVEVEEMPAINIPEPKRRFVPSKWEAQKIAYLVKAIRKGWIKLDEEPTDKKPKYYEIWTDEEPELTRRQRQHIAAPKSKLPGHAASYNPPEEYLFSAEEKKKWEDDDPEDRELDFIPQKFDRLLHVPANPRAIQERFQRCLDLYLCPRAIVKRQNVDPESLLPSLPSPQELRPFPTTLSITFRGHTDKLRSITLDPTGQFLASGGDDCTVRIWEVTSGRCMRVMHFDKSVRCVRWNPGNTPILGVASGKTLFLIDVCMDGSQDVVDRIAELLEYRPPAASDRNQVNITWSKEVADSTGKNWGNYTALLHEKAVEEVTWHRRGDYFSTLCPGTHRAQVLIHKLSIQQTQNPFKKMKGIVANTCFHPSKPFFFVATQRSVRVYNLMRNQLVKKLTPGVREISSLSVHPGGDNLLIGSYDMRVCWFDLDFSTKPYRVLRYHKGPVRGVSFHQKYPLFASTSDDGLTHIFHGMVYEDLLKNPLIVPLTALKGHNDINGLAAMSTEWHPTQPWIFTAGADKDVHMFTQ